MICTSGQVDPGYHSPQNWPCVIPCWGRSWKSREMSRWSHYRTPGKLTSPYCQSRSRPSRMTFYTLRQSHPCITRLQCPIQLWMIPHPRQTATHDAFVDHPSASWSLPKTKGLNILGGRKCSISAVWFVWCKLNCSFYSLVCAYVHIGL